MPLLTTKHLRLPWIKCHLSLQTCLYCDNVKDKKSKPTGNKYRDTVYLPKTDFVLSLKKAGDGFKKSELSELYKWQQNENRNKQFILHDGPPYANGKLHVGHAINKVLKDIINRYNLLQGYRVHYVPGWDCHGLPIELKALKKNKKTDTL